MTDKRRELDPKRVYTALIEAHLETQKTDVMFGKQIARSPESLTPIERAWRKPKKFFKKILKKLSRLFGREGDD